MLSPELKEQTTGLWKRDELPKGLRWLEHLSPLHYRLCLVELKDAVSEACLTDDWSRVAELVEDWEATAAIDALPATQRPRLIHVGDRESDITDVLRQIAGSPDGMVIRNQYAYSHLSAIPLPEFLSLICVVPARIPAHSHLRSILPARSRSAVR